MGLLAGAHGAVARALENQVYTVHSPVVGASPWSAACPANCGMAGIFAPSDVGFPPGGVLALGEMNKPQWVYAEVDLDLIAKVRASGGVQTYKHWPEQPGAGRCRKRRSWIFQARSSEWVGKALASSSMAAKPACKSQALTMPMRKPPGGMG